MRSYKLKSEAGLFSWCCPASTAVLLPGVQQRWFRCRRAPDEEARSLSCCSFAPSAPSGSAASCCYTNLKSADVRLASLVLLNVTASLASWVITTPEPTCVA